MNPLAQSAHSSISQSSSTSSA